MHARLRLLVTLALLCPMGATAAPGRTIVGRWAPDPEQCTPIGGAIEIRPLGIVGDTMRCTFTGVARSGDVVTWRGRCGFPEPARPMTVVAALRGEPRRGETLAIRYGGGPADSYRRCRP